MPTTIDYEKWEKARSIFFEAIRLGSDERDRFVNKACAGDPELLAEVRSLLDSSVEAGSFLETPLSVDSPTKITEHLSAGQLVGHYSVIRQLGRGGMGEVYLADDSKLRRKVAIKVLPASSLGNADAARRFRQEALAASALNHPGILTIHEIGEHEGASYIVSEYVDGVTLRDRICRGNITVENAVDIALQVGSALAAAHDVGIIHRDIKPENIMIRPDGLVKVLDFGLVKLDPLGLGTRTNDETATQMMTASGMIMGTASYMSPEQARGLPVDSRTDIWSLGVVLYEMIAGVAPFKGDTTADTLVAVVDKDPPRLADVVSNEIPDGIDRAVSTALSKDRDDRYDSVAKFTADLKRSVSSLSSAGAHTERDAARNNYTESLNRTKLLTRGPVGKTLLNRWSRVALILIGLAGLSVIGILLYERWNRTSTAGEIKSIAILPVRALDDSENSLGLGIADGVIRRISETGELTVRPISAVRRYLLEDTDALTAARQLGVDAVLDGTIQHGDGRIRVSINLLRTSDGHSLGTDQFEVNSTDSLTVQDLVAEKVASRLRLKIDPKDKERLTKQSTTNPTAYDYYNRGVYSFDKRINANLSDMETTIGYFRNAVNADPNFALAHAQLAYAYALTAVFTDPTEPKWAPLASAEADRAESLDPQLAEVHLARWALLMSQYGGFDTRAAIRQALSAQQLDPNVGNLELGYAFAHLSLEDFTEKAYNRAAEIDPTSDNVKQQTLTLYFCGARYDDFATAFQKMYPGKPIDEAWYFLGKGQLDDAKRTIEKTQAAVKSGSADPLSALELPNRSAMLDALKSNFTAAEAEIPNILSKYPVKNPLYHHAAYDIACIYALEGKTSEAIKWLREAASTGLNPYAAVTREHYFDRIRQSPEFIAYFNDLRSKNAEYRSEFADWLSH
jgi:serine/threonine-protein kinase